MTTTPNVRTVIIIHSNDDDDDIIGSTTDDDDDVVVGVIDAAVPSPAIDAKDDIMVSYGCSTRYTKMAKPTNTAKPTNLAMR